MVRVSRVRTMVCGGVDSGIQTAIGPPTSPPLSLCLSRHLEPLFLLDISPSHGKKAKADIDPSPGPLLSVNGPRAPVEYINCLVRDLPYLLSTFSEASSKHLGQSQEPPCGSDNSCPS